MVIEIKKDDPRLFHIQYVKEVFTKVLSKYIKDEKIIKKLFKQVITAYCKKDRHYHDMNHIYGMVSLWETYKHLLTDADVIFFAIIYHDIVYNPKKNDNEEKSVDFFVQKITPFILTMLYERMADVMKAIRATKHNEESKKYWENNKDIQYLLDFDLDVLGTRHKDTYDWYRTGVRKEYSMYPLKAYKAGRKAVLESFLKRKEIYLTPEFKKIEKIARKNLNNEIKTYLC